MSLLRQYFNDFMQLFFPEICVTCGQKLITQEEYICLNCLHDLPRTNFHNMPGNFVEQLFWGRVIIERATSYFFFSKGSKYQRLIHFMKYKGMKEVGESAGWHFGQEIKAGQTFNGVDLVVPVPLHSKKLRERGYNQSEWIAKGVAGALEKPIDTDNLQRVVFTNTQTRKTRFERWQNVDGIFNLCQPQVFEGKHILLVDDVVTTGSTLEACAVALQKAPGIKISIATLAVAN